MREALAPNRDIAITEIGVKPGEKMYEELMNAEEVRRTYEYGNFFITLSAFTDAKDPTYVNIRNRPSPTRPYNSSHEPALCRARLRAFWDLRDLRGP
jgi:FlaA1/EpsC-like NDP-sugar epimerase